MVEFATGHIWVWSFLCGKAFNYIFSFFHSYNLFWLFMSSCLTSDNFWLGRSWPISSESSNLCAELFLVFSYYPFSCLWVCNNILYFIPHIENSYLFPFFASLASGGSICRMFQRTRFLIHLFYLLFFSF